LNGGEETGKVGDKDWVTIKALVLGGGEGVGFCGSLGLVGIISVSISLLYDSYLRRL
jgi:hypothetical protein